MPSTAELGAQFGQVRGLTLEDVSGTTLVRIAADRAEALISLKGAQVLSYTPQGHPDILWLSPDAWIAGPAPTRGGVPVCWPWFADHPTDKASKPLHGFARTATWELLEVRNTPGDDAILRLCFETGGEHATLWPHRARLELTVTIGERLSLSLETQNTGETTIELTQALHAYFHVGHVERATVAGLDNVTYLDKTDAFNRKVQQGPVRFGTEVDRIYVGTSGPVTIADPLLRREIQINKIGSSSTVVWNPAPERAARMGDLGPDGWREFVCVETANAGDDIVVLGPGQRHVLSATYFARPTPELSTAF